MANLEQYTEEIREAGYGSRLQPEVIAAGLEAVAGEGERIIDEHRGIANGLAGLDGSGKVPPDQLPSYVDDVVEYADLSSFPETGEQGKIYVALDTNSIYRWSGSTYIEVTKAMDLDDYATKKDTVLETTLSRGRLPVDVENPMGYGSFAFGNGVVASGSYSHAEGNGTKATQDSAHAEGGGNTASGRQSHAEGGGTKATGDYSHAEGGAATASGNAAHAEGGGTQANNVASHAEGAYTIASGEYSHAEGNKAKAIGKGAHAEGCETQANGDYSHAEGVGTRATEDYSHAEGNGAAASGYYSHAEGFSTTASGQQSHAEGSATTASGVNSHAEGNNAEASGADSHAEGGATTASGLQSHAEGHGGVITNLNPQVTESNTKSGSYGKYSHSEGNITRAYGDGSHSEGTYTVANAYSSHAEGYKTYASGLQSHAEGNTTQASGDQSHAEGEETTASQSAAHAEGKGTTASGQYSHAEGKETTASQSAAHAEGKGTTASGQYSHAEGSGTTASSTAAHAEGRDTKATKAYSHAEGSSAQANGDGAHAEGSETKANGYYSHAEGKGTTASGQNSHAEGSGTTASGSSAHTEGSGTNASNLGSHAEGYNTQSSGTGSHAEGYSAKANGQGSHAEGNGTQANGDYSHAEGCLTLANSDYQHVFGKNNVADNNSVYAEIVGGGESENARANIRTLEWNGSEHLAGDLFVRSDSTGAGGVQVATVEEVNALTEQTRSKLDMPETNGLVGQMLCVSPDGKPSWGYIEDGLKHSLFMYDWLHTIAADIDKLYKATGTKDDSNEYGAFADNFIVDVDNLTLKTSVLELKPYEAVRVPVIVDPPDGTLTCELVSVTEDIDSIEVAQDGSFVKGWQAGDQAVVSIRPQKPSTRYDSNCSSLREGTTKYLLVKIVEGVAPLAAIKIEKRIMLNRSVTSTIYGTFKSYYALSVYDPKSGNSISTLDEEHWDNRLTIASSDTMVASVNDNAVTGVSLGDAVITASYTTESGQVLTDSFDWVYQLKIYSSTYIDSELGKQNVFYAIFSPDIPDSEVDPSKLAWSSSNTDIISLSPKTNIPAAVYTVNATGFAVITATYTHDQNHVYTAKYVWTGEV